MITELVLQEERGARLVGSKPHFHCEVEVLSGNSQLITNCVSSSSNPGAGWKVSVSEAGLTVGFDCTAVLYQLIIM